MLRISSRAWQMLRIAVLHNPKLEVGGFGKAIITDDGVELVDILVPPQEIGGAHVDIEVEDLDWLLGQLLARGESPKDWFVWWHSHAGMSTGPSMTDHTTLRTLAEQHSANVAVGLVTNAKGECTAWANYRSPLAPGLLTEASLSVEIVEEFDPELHELVSGFMEHVTERKWAAQPAASNIQQFLSKTTKPPRIDKDAAWAKYRAGGWQSLTDAECEAVLDFYQDRDVADPFLDAAFADAGALL